MKNVLRSFGVLVILFFTISSVGANYQNRNNLTKSEAKLVSGIVETLFEEVGGKYGCKSKIYLGRIESFRNYEKSVSRGSKLNIFFSSIRSGLENKCMTYDDLPNRVKELDYMVNSDYYNKKGDYVKTLNGIEIRQTLYDTYLYYGNKQIMSYSNRIKDDEALLNSYNGYSKLLGPYGIKNGIAKLFNVKSFGGTNNKFIITKMHDHGLDMWIYNSGNSSLFKMNAEKIYKIKRSKNGYLFLAYKNSDLNQISLYYYDGRYARKILNVRGLYDYSIGIGEIKGYYKSDYNYNYNKIYTKKIRW